MTNFVDARKPEVKIPDTVLRPLLDMLTYRRKARSDTEIAFIKRFIAPLGGAPDGYGNHIVKIGDKPSLMYSCHTDSVHSKPGFQLVGYANGVLYLADQLPKGDGKRKNRKKAKYKAVPKLSGNMTGLPSYDRGCLGADDAAGCYIMSEMIKARREGLYVFHRDEESGGHGSRWIAKNTPSLVDGIKAVIAFDRRGKTDVITHQMAGRTASDDFAKSLAEQLGPNYRPSSGGTFTDSANYTDLVGECTNISVGYEGEHTSSETLSVSHILHVRNAMLALDPTKLVFKRKPGERESYYGRGSGSYYGGYGGYDDYSDYGRYGRYDEGGSYESAADDYDPHGAFRGSEIAANFTGMVDLIRHNTIEVAEILEQLGYDAKSLRQEIMELSGRVICA